MSKTQYPDGFSESTDEGIDRHPRDHGIFDDEFSRESQDIDEIIAFIAANLKVGQRMLMPFGFLPEGSHHPRLKNSDDPQRETIVHANGHRFHIPVVPPAKQSFVAACTNCQADETPAPAPQPVYGEVKEMRGFVMRLDPGCAQFLQTLKPINLDLNAKPGTVPTTTPMFVSGTVFYTPHKLEGLGELLKEGMPVQVRTCIPPHNFHGDTCVFDNMLQFRTITAVDGTASLYIVDPRPPEMVEGTPEYKIRVGSIKYTP